MRSRSSKQEKRKEIHIDNLRSNKVKEEPRLSGTYIRSLVKQLSTSKTKDSMDPKNQSSSTVALGEGFDETEQTKPTQQDQQPQQHKKQIRRRLQTSRPYQERLLNMAEARREIVTALKFHRASMKQATRERGQEEDQKQKISNSCVEEQPQIFTKSRRNPRSSNTPDNFSNNLSRPVPHPPLAFSWSPYTISPLPYFAENYMNFTLPNQTLSLNLNFHDFNNLDATLFQNNKSPSSSALSPSSSSFPSTISIPNSVSTSQEVRPCVRFDGGGGGLHVAVDDDEMTEIRSIGKKHEMEWSDTVNLVKSARWFRYLRRMELGGHQPELKFEEDDCGYNYHTYDEVMEFPAWPEDTNERRLQQHFLDDCCTDYYFQVPALPCMDIGEIESMDEEWLA